MSTGRSGVNRVEVLQLVSFVQNRLRMVAEDRSVVEPVVLDVVKWAKGRQWPVRTALMFLAADFLDSVEGTRLALDATDRSRPLNRSQVEALKNVQAVVNGVSIDEAAAWEVVQNMEEKELLDTLYVMFLVCAETHRFLDRRRSGEQRDV